MEEEQLSTIDEILTELEELCRCYQPEAVRLLETPGLARAASDLGIDRDQLTGRAIENIADDRYRKAALALLADPVTRFENFTARSSLAAAHFGNSADAFRRAGKDGRSSRSKVLLEVSRHISMLRRQIDDEKRRQSVALANAEIATDGATKPSEIVQSATDVPATDVRDSTEKVLDQGDPVSSPRGNHRLLPSIGIMAVVLAVITGAVLSQRSSSVEAGGEPEATPNTTAQMVTSLEPEPADVGTSSLEDGLRVSPVVEGVSVTSPTAVSAVQLLGEVDVTLHCLTEHGQGSSAAPDPSSSTEWVCRTVRSAEATPANLQLACEQQYGDEAEAVNLAESSGNWRCATTVAPAIDDGCVVEAGDFNPSMADRHSPYAVGFRQRYELAGGAEALGCPTQLMHRWADGTLQELRDADGNTAALLAVEAENPILLTNTAWLAFDRIKGITGGLVGYPMAEPSLVDGTYEIPLSAGGALIADKPGSPFHWIPPVVFARWIDFGGRSSCLGMPISDPYTDGASFRQDFEQGSFSLSTTAGTMTVSGSEC